MLAAAAALVWRWRRRRRAATAGGKLGSSAQPAWRGGSSSGHAFGGGGGCGVKDAEAAAVEHEQPGDWSEQSLTTEDVVLSGESREQRTGP